MQLNSMGGARKIMPIWNYFKSLTIVGVFRFIIIVYLVPCHRKLEHENNEACEQLPFSDGAHQILNRIIGFLACRGC